MLKETHLLKHFVYLVGLHIYYCGMFGFRAPLLQALIGVFELPEDESTLPDDHYIEVDDTPGYQAAFSQLAFADKKDHDPLNGIQSSLYSCVMIKY